MEQGDAICRVGSQSCEAIRRDFLHFLISCRRWASSSHVLQSVSSLRIAWVPFIQDTPKIIVAGYGHFEFSDPILDRKSTRLNSSHQIISYAVFCLKKKTTRTKARFRRTLRAER